MEKIVGYGELMLRLTPENDDFLVTFSEKLLSTYGGSEANSLSFLGRRGYDCEFLSSFPNNELGNKAISFLKTHGVKVNANIDKHRLGKYFVIPGTNNKLSKIIYDRKNSSFSKFKLNDSIIKKSLDTQVQPKDLGKFLKLLSENLIDFDHFKFMFGDFYKRFYLSGGYMDSEINENELKLFLDEHEDILQILSTAHIEKIKQHKQQSIN